MAVVCTATARSQGNHCPNLQGCLERLVYQQSCEAAAIYEKVCAQLLTALKLNRADGAIAARMYGFYSPLNAPNTVTFSKGS